METKHEYEKKKKKPLFKCTGSWIHWQRITGDGMVD